MVTTPALACRDTGTRFVNAIGNRFAYRSLGRGDRTPVVLLNRWGANLDNVDSRIADGLSG